MIRDCKIDLEYQNYIAAPPVPPEQLYATATSNDDITMKSWKDTWIKNAVLNKEKIGSFCDNGIGKIYDEYALKPVIIAGSGPSLANNVQLLAHRNGIPLVSCLHNFHYMEDNGAAPEYYVTLDAGDITLAEVAEGGQKSLDEYLEISKDRTLLAYVGASPKLINSWKGKILWYNCPVPSEEITKGLDEVEKFGTMVSCGGNVLGACFYIAKAILGANPIVFVGADFCFSYDNKFHAWDSRYDKDLGQYMRQTDVFGNSVKTWRSYWGFKCWFDNRCSTVPGLYINCSEGGLLGSYKEGNISQITQLPLANVLEMYKLNGPVRAQCENPGDVQQQDKVVML